MSPDVWVLFPEHLETRFDEPLHVAALISHDVMREVETDLLFEVSTLLMTSGIVWFNEIITTV